MATQHRELGEEANARFAPGFPRPRNLLKVFAVFNDCVADSYVAVHIIAYTHDIVAAQYIIVTMSRVLEREGQTGTWT